MKAPDQDLEGRRVIWDYMQSFWTNTDPWIQFRQVVQVCAGSSYSLEDLEAIFWNEVRPAVSFNLSQRSWAAREWSGFEMAWLTEWVLETHRFGKPLPPKWLHPYVYLWWRRLRDGIAATRRAAQAATGSAREPDPLVPIGKRS